VADQFTDPHPLVQRTAQSLESARPDEHGLVRPRARQCLAVEVSPALADRALRIFDALLKGLDARGYSVTVTDDEKAKTVVEVLGENIAIRLAKRAASAGHSSGPPGRADQSGRLLQGAGDPASHATHPSAERLTMGANRHASSP
jgi:hypothetical protein